ncbi:hypothetical protein [Mesorhizobium sp. WSM3859]|uniref:hypothetical protein n=1 Tax=Mesorhizobium sp. WSM3859 TaxID=2029402 RepID=UPI0032AF27C0
MLVRSDLQGHGLGWDLLKQLICYAKADGIGRIEGIILTKIARCSQCAGSSAYRLRTMLASRDCPWRR